MYEFLDRGDRRMALRPEGTAAICRAFVQHRPAVPWKVYYRGPYFRYEAPQAGRFRQFHQFGIESIGSDAVREEGNPFSHSTSISIVTIKSLDISQSTVPL